MVFLIILIVLILLYVFLLIPRLPRRDMSALTKVDYAHRGLWNAQRPENSLSAFRSAVDAGYGIELDVHRTKDGVLVVHHDDNLKRVCGVDRRIAQSTLAEVRACHLSGTDEVVPTFDEVLEAVGGRVPLIVELKVEQNVDSLCSAVRERMQHYNGLWCMESFDPARGAVVPEKRAGNHPRTACLRTWRRGCAQGREAADGVLYFHADAARFEPPGFSGVRSHQRTRAESADAPCAPDAPVDGRVDDSLAGRAGQQPPKVRHRDFRGLRAAGKTQLNPVKSDSSTFSMTTQEKASIMEAVP